MISGVCCGDIGRGCIAGILRYTLIPSARSNEINEQMRTQWVRLMTQLKLDFPNTALLKPYYSSVEIWSDPIGGLDRPIGTSLALTIM